ncbi:MAG: tryptophan synthase subunit alpha [Acidobacteria bacterium]|nr:MAG: tryptophan synthase subunit alpha [Acidobacteriota bacterium]REK01554.1 MAG: tryptophan synthase subunit alpha [Acidobacteriota bacterium]REK14510.1 MAG: tryptophan synthase subunit alpha [Acidobacteriota bacterium]REK45225.1 MAG: tryptophan synthase subunit alpha [Acidobacteriota bacterium]
MSIRIDSAFERLASRGGKGFIPFITAGDPDPETTLELIVMLAEHGSTVIELGVPFTDPMADGPVIQRSSQRALENGHSDLASILRIVKEARKRTEVPIILFGYLNPFLAYGFERLKQDAWTAGVDGFLITDVVDEEFAELSRELGSSDLDLISLIAPTTTDERIEKIVRSARGFIYAVSRTGVTGQGSEMRDSAEELVIRIRTATNLPVAVGFGISTAGQVSDVLRFADAAVVGSGIVKVIETAAEGSVVDDVRHFVSNLLSNPKDNEASGKSVAT